MENEKLGSLGTVERQDGWVNLVTSVGTSNDKRMMSAALWEPRNLEWYEQLYTADELASRIVNVVPEEALRKGWEWTGVDKKIQIAVQKKAADLDLKGAILRSWQWGRAYGGACTYIVTDTTDPASPLRVGERVIGLRDLSRYDLRILTTDVEADFGSPNWGHPKIYYLQVMVGSQYRGYPIHWTRMVRWDGYLLPRRTFIRNNYWHDSILNRLYNAIRNYQTSNDAAASILHDFNVGIYKMKGLAQMIGAGREEVIKNRIEMLNYSKSVIRAMLLDSDEEEFEDLSRSVDGLAELLTKQANRLVAATELPHTKLLGESPDGSNATGNSTTAQWFDHIQSEQENYLRPKLQRLVDAIFYDIPDLQFKFKPLYQLTELEQADLRNKTAQTDQIYLSTGVLDPSEVAQSRFGGEEYSVETQLDEEAREAGLIGQAQPNSNLFPPENGGGDESQPDELESGSDQDQDENFEEKTGTQPPEGQDTPVGLGRGAPIGQAEGNPIYTEKAFDPMAEAYEQAKEEAALPESLQNIKPNPKGTETGSGGTQFDFRNEEIEAKEKIKPFISMSMSEPMRDPKTDPRIKPGGRPNQSRTIMPTLGNGVIAPSGAQFKSDSVDSSIPIKKVSVVGVICNDSILLGQRRDSGKWVMPGGHSDGDETPEQTASRELEEESGIKIPPEKLKFVGTSTGKTPEGLFSVDCFVVDLGEKPDTSTHLDPDQEVSKWDWVDISQGLPKEVKDSLHHDNTEPFKQLGVM